MDAPDSRATIRERLDSRQIDAETLNLVAFWMSRELEGMEFRETEAKEVCRHLLRVVGRLLIDTGTPQGVGAWSDTREQVLLWLRDCVHELGYDLRPREGAGQPELADPSADWF